MNEIAPGAVLGDCYRLDEVLGEGGMGRVYAATHLRVPRRFAVKVLAPDLVATPGALERFQREAEIAGALGSEHIVQVFDCNRTPSGLPYMVLELLDGEDLAARLRRGPLDLVETAAVLRQTAAALGVAHRHGIVHRDLKPSNLFLTRGGLKVLDFGISKVLSARSTGTRTGMILGTPNYMAPEQAEGRVDEIDARADLFALGVILYECLTGRVAFDGDTGMSTLYKICHHEPPPLRSLAPHVPPAVVACVARAMAKRREARFADAGELSDAFTAALGQTTLGGFAGERAPRRRRTRRLPALVAVALAATGALLALPLAREPLVLPPMATPIPRARPAPPPPPPPLPVVVLPEPPPFDLAAPFGGAVRAIEPLPRRAPPPARPLIEEEW